MELENTRFQELMYMKRTYIETAKKHGREIVLEVFKAFFDANPNVHGITWLQYTPYWCDGEPCTFAVHQTHALMTCEAYVAGGYGDEATWKEGMEDFNGYDSYFDRYTLCGTELGENLHELDNFIGSGGCQELMLFAFGDHVKITVTSDLDVTIEEYEHQ